MQINEFKAPTTSENFDDFDNMFKGIDRENYTSAYIAIIVVDRVRLERNPSRSRDVDLWYDEIFSRRRNIVQTSDNSNNESDVSDIEE